MIRDFLRSVPARLSGVHVELNAERVERLPIRPCWTDKSLTDRQDAAYERLKAEKRNVDALGKYPDRRLVEDQPDTFVKTEHVPEDAQ